MGIGQDNKADIEQDDKVGTERDYNRMGDPEQDGKRATDLAIGSHSRQDNDGMSDPKRDDKRVIELVIRACTRVLRLLCRVFLSAAHFNTFFAF